MRHLDLPVVVLPAGAVVDAVVQLRAHAAGLEGRHDAGDGCA